MIDPSRLAKLYEEALHRAVEALTRSRVRIHLTDLLRCKRLFYFENVSPRRGDEIEKRRVSLVKLFGTFLHEFLEIDGCVKELHMEWCRGGVCIVARPDFWCPETRTVVELKTVARLANIPRLNHLAQLRVYMTLLSASRGVLAYVSRTTGEIKLFEVTGGAPSDAIELLWRRAEAYAEILRRGSGAGAPGPEPGLWCRNCPYRSGCSGRVEEARVGETELQVLLKKLAGKE